MWFDFVKRHAYTCDAGLATENWDTPGGLLAIWFDPFKPYECPFPCGKKGGGWVRSKPKPKARQQAKGLPGAG